MLGKTFLPGLCLTRFRGLLKALGRLLRQVQLIALAARSRRCCSSPEMALRLARLFGIRREILVKHSGLVDSLDCCAVGQEEVDRNQAATLLAITADATGLPTLRFALGFVTGDFAGVSLPKKGRPTLQKLLPKRSVNCFTNGKPSRQWNAISAKYSKNYGPVGVREAAEEFCRYPKLRFDLTMELK